MSADKRSKNDTWNEADLLASIKGADKGKKKSRHKDGEDSLGGESSKVRREKKSRDRGKDISDRTSLTVRKGSEGSDTAADLLHHKSDHRSLSEKNERREKTAGEGRKTSKSKPSHEGIDRSNPKLFAGEFDRLSTGEKEIKRKQSRKNTTDSAESKRGSDKRLHDEREDYKRSTQKDRKAVTADDDRKRIQESGLAVTERENLLKQSSVEDVNQKRLRDTRTRDHQEVTKSDKVKREVSAYDQTINNNVPVEKNDADDYNYDDEEFDDYDDDNFEDDDDGPDAEQIEEESREVPSSDISSHDLSGVERDKSQLNLHLSASEQKDLNEVLKAINAENHEVSSGIIVASGSQHATATSGKARNKIARESKARGDRRDDPVPAKSKSVGKINFVAAKQKQITSKVAKKAWSRGQELLSLVQLDARSIDIFEMAPLTEYEVYMKRFGSSNCQQVYTQTREDYLSQDIQTDEIEVEERWCQHTHDVQACGSGAGLSASASDYHLLGQSTVNSDVLRLNAFLQQSGQVCLLLLEEKAAGIDGRSSHYTESSTAFSDGFVTLSSSDFLFLGREFCAVAFSPVQTNLLLTAYGPSQVVEKDSKAPKGLICVWNTNEPLRPYQILVCESTPRCCCFSAGKASLAFAGMDDGVVALWDLRESASRHVLRKLGNDLIAFRSATYTTAYLRSKEGHFSPVVGIATTSTYSSNDGPQGASVGNIGMSFQVASLEENGIINIWVVVEVTPSMEVSSVDADLGLVPHGRTKLVKSGSMSIFDSGRESLLLPTCLQVHPDNPNQFFIGTAQGKILNVTRFKKKCVPGSFQSSFVSPVKISALDPSPWKMPCMLACGDSGAVWLYHLRRGHPIFEWCDFSEGSKVLDVRWSRSKPSVFYAMDDNSVLYTWDLLQDNAGPLMKQKVKRKDKRAIGFALANDYAGLGVGLAGRAAEMLLVYGDGSVEVHRLSKKLSVSAGDDFDRFLALVEELA